MQAAIEVERAFELEGAGTSNARVRFLESNIYDLYEAEEKRLGVRTQEEIPRGNPAGGSYGDPAANFSPSYPSYDRAA